MVSVRKLALFLLSSPQSIRQRRHCNQIWSRCIHQLTERRPTPAVSCQSKWKPERALTCVSKRPRGPPPNPIPIHIPYQRIDELSRQLLHSFRDNETLATAMVHKSLFSGGYGHEVFAEVKPGIVKQITSDNERLELLGDKVIGLVACDHLLQAHPNFDEGQLSHIIQSTVSNKDLSRYCRTLRLDSFVVMSRHVRLLRWSCQPGNFFEALMGALFMDGGLPAASKFFSKRVANLLEMKLLRGENNDPKRLLQEHLVASGLPGNDLHRLLKYVPVSNVQKSGSQSFTQAIHLLGKRLSIGSGASRIRADQIAATRLLANLKTRKNTACILIRLARSSSEELVLEKAKKVRKKLGSDP